MIAVTGATGNVGSKVVKYLLAEGQEVLAITRSSSAVLPAGVEVLRADPSRPATLGSALRRVTAAFVHPRAVGDGAGEFVAFARRQGVERVVALSAMNIDAPLEDQPSRFQGDRNKEAEEAVVESGLEWVSLRASSYASNTIRMWAPQISAGDVVRYVYPAFAESSIDERDLGEVAAHALAFDENLTGRRLVLTGPQSLTHRQMVEIIGDVVGRRLQYQEIPPDAAAQGMIQRGLPEPFVRALMARYARETGKPALVTDEVQRILGRPARRFREWVIDNSAAFQPVGESEPLEASALP